ncbi:MULTISPECIES: IS21 family transposase [unclassified Pseudoalteromonas]|jgi:transposase|uniref:IS21 family transposase n=1 Tax=unclassified Pseudoalteromonas TaxID=194690 RepID=UPI0004021CF2|nr:MULTISPECIES: IS21 family transposase [unclassified Pseudoalteromonas]
MLKPTQIRAAIRAKFVLPDITIRKQADFANASPSSMVRVNKRCEKYDVDHLLAEQLNDEALIKLMFPDILKNAKKRVPKIQYIVEERTKEKGKRKSITVLYLEYYAEDPMSAMSYSHFCRTIKKVLKRCKLSMKQLHAAGEVVYIDYAGTKVCYNVDGEKVWAKVFVAVLGSSQKIFAFATPGETTADWIEAMRRMFIYFGGATEVVVMDNAKALVSQPGLIPTFVENVSAFGDHYNCLMDSCRVGRPKDKALAELGVKFVTQRILIPMNQDWDFFSLKEVNQHLSKEVEVLNNLNFQGLDFSRNDLFYKNEKGVLNPLPHTDFDMIVEKLIQQVSPEYTVKYRNHEYSVPWMIHGESVEVYATLTHLRIVHMHQLVAEHELVDDPKGSTILEEHMHPDHLADLESNDMGKNLAWAVESGSHVSQLVELWYSKVNNPRSRAIGKRCRALMKLSDKKGSNVLNDACEYALQHDMLSVSDVELVVRAQVEQEGIKNLPAYIAAHENVRGSAYYGGSHEA